jgi:hypothetical protein
MPLSPEDYHRIHEVERRILDGRLSMESRKKAVESLLEFGADAEPILLGIATGMWLVRADPLPGELLDEAMRCVWILRESRQTRGGAPTLTPSAIRWTYC